MITKKNKTYIIGVKEKQQCIFIENKNICENNFTDNSFYSIENQIQKNIFFIWIGYIPNYVHKTIQYFQEKNQDFKINTYIFRSINEAYKNEDVKEVIDLTNKKNNFFNSWFNRKYYKEKCTSNVAQLSDVLRWYLLNKYGGIYLDCDTFPIRSFDNRLLNMQSFYISRIVKNNFYRDSFFTGFRQGFLDDIFINSAYISNSINENKFLQMFRLKLKNNIFNYLDPEVFSKDFYEKYNLFKNKFENGFLVENDTYIDLNYLKICYSYEENHYIDHYFCRVWK